MTRYSVLYGNELDARIIAEKKLANCREQLDNVTHFLAERDLLIEYANWIIQRTRDANPR